MQQYFSILKNCPLFRGITEDDLCAMLGCLGARVVSVQRGETVLAEGSPAKYVGIVLAGQMQIEQTDYYGNRSIMARVGPGELFGESFACAGVPRLPVDVTAVEPGEVMLIDCQRITVSCSNACNFHSSMIFNLLQVVARKNLLFHQKLEITARRSTREKLMAYLLSQAKQQGSSRFTIPFDRQALADYLGVDRSGLSAEISKLRKEGILKSERYEFELL